MSFILIPSIGGLQARKKISPRAAPAFSQNASIWLDADVGTSKRAGASATEDAVLAVAGAGERVGGTADSFHFMYQALSGDVDLVAHVVDIGDGHPFAETGVMIRGDLSSDASHASLMAIRKSGVAFERRLAKTWTTLSSATTQDALGAWLRLERRGSQISAFVSDTGSSWQMVGSELVNLDAVAYVGVVVASHQPNVLVTAVLDSVSARQILPPSESPSPSVPVTASPAPLAQQAAPGWPDIPGSPTGPGTSTSDSPTPPSSPSPTSSVTELPPPIVPNVIPDPPQPLIPDPGSLIPDPGSLIHDPLIPDPLIRDPLIPDPGSPIPVRPAAESSPASSTGGIVVPTVIPPRYLAFAPSSDNDTNVDGYTLEIRLASSPDVTVTAFDLGKPSVTAGECRVEVGFLLQRLAAGDYVALVIAVNGAGPSAAASSDVFSL